MPRFAYSITIGIVMQYFLFRDGMINFFLMCLVTKILMHKVQREKQGFIIFFAALAHSTFYLTLEMIYNYGDTSVNYTFYVMFLCQKLSTLGYCYQDGMGKFSDTLTPHQKECRLFRIPTLVEIIGYATYP